MDRMNIYERLGIPDSLKVTLSVFCIALLLAPYLGGADFGLFKIPKFPNHIVSVLRWLGPVAFLIAVALFVPVIPTPGSRPRSFDADWWKERRGVPLNRREITRSFDAIASSELKDNIWFVVELVTGEQFTARLSAQASGGPDGFMYSFATRDGVMKHATIGEIDIITVLSVDA